MLSGYVRLDRINATYDAGEEMVGQCVLPIDLRDEVESVEISVLWTTEGKGDEDQGVHQTISWRLEGGEPSERSFSLRLPSSPLSYDGVIVKIAWCVRTMLFFKNGATQVHDLPFRLGHVSMSSSMTP